MNRKNLNRILIPILPIFLVIFVFNMQMNLPDFNPNLIEYQGLNTSGTFTSTVVIDATDPLNDWADAVSAGVCTGSGTVGNPYVIEDHTFDISSGSALVILNSRAYFKIENCTFINPISMESSVYMMNTSNGIVNDNKGGALYRALELNNCSHIVITNNNYTNCGYTVVFSWSHHLTFNNNFLSNSVYDALTLDNCNDCLIENNDILDTPGDYAIIIADSHYNRVRNNLINVSQYGILCVISNGSILENNRIYESSLYGIYLSSSHHSTISGNEVINSTTGGLEIDDGMNNIVSSNEFVLGGIRLVGGATKNEIINNEASQSQYGLYLDTSDFNLCEGNQLHHNEFDGIYLLASHNNTLHNNDALTNDDDGIQHGTFSVPI